MHTPSYHPDMESIDSPHQPRKSPYVHVHGNAKPNEPTFMSMLPKKAKLRPVSHPHKQPWTASMAPGKREHKSEENVYHRMWFTDQGNQGRWNRSRKQEFFEKQDKDLLSLKPHDEKHATGTNWKYWTNLDGEGTRTGGFHKLDYVPQRQTGLHLKHGFYTGKFENIKHKQIIIKSGNRGKDGKKQEIFLDTREPFDNRLHDDVLRTTHERDIGLTLGSYDLMRPSKTLSLPQLGAEFTYR